MPKAGPFCRQCWLKPARSADEFYSDVCLQDWNHRCERIRPARETTAGELVQFPWTGAQRANLQNSA